MKLHRIASPDEMEREYMRRLKPCTLRTPLLVGGVILVGLILALMFSSPYLPGGSQSGFPEDVYAPDFPY